MKIIYTTLLILFGVLFSSEINAQTVRPVTYYPMQNWDTSPYKSFRYTRKNASWEWINFRLLFPNGYDSTAVDGKQYPIIVMLHGAGESGRMEWNNTKKINVPYPENDPRRDNNDHHLLFGGREHLRAVQSGRFPGFVLFPQNSYGTWVNGNTSSDFHQDLAKAIELVEYLVKNLKIDPARIYIHGLSAGGLGTWLAVSKRPDLFAAALPMSAPGNPEMADQLAKVPLWVFQGELDTNPRPWVTKQTVEAVRNAGGTVRYTEYAGVEHNTWNRAYGERDFFEWMLSQRKADTTAPNQAPVVNAGQDKTITLPTNTASFTATASDPDGTIASYQWQKVSGPEVSMNGTTSSTLNLSNLVEGNYTFSIAVTDNKGAMASDEVQLVVSSPANQAPTVNAGTDKTVTLPTNTTTFTATASDPDGSIASYLWEKMQGPEVGMSNTTTATLSLSNLMEGSYTFKVTVTDNKGSKATDEVGLIVREAPNQAPTVSAGANKEIALPANTASFTATASDPDGNISSYLWEKVSGPAVTMSGTSIPTLSLSDLVEGQYTFKVTVTDNRGGTATAQVSLKVNPAPNQFPVVNAGEDKTLTLPINSTSITATASDPDGTIASYLWEKLNGPAATLSGTTTATLGLSNLVQGSYTFVVTVTDNRGGKATDEVKVVVNEAPNQAPLVNAGEDKSITLPTNSTSFTATASDSDGSIATYSWEKINGPAATLANASTKTLSVSGLVEGTYTFRVTVTDNRGEKAMDEVQLAVNPAANVAPTVNAGTDKTVTLPTNTATFTATATDPDGTIATYLWEKVNGPAVNMVNASTSTVTLNNLVEGSYTFRVTVTDNKGAKAWDEVKLTVNPAPNQPPVVNAGQDKSLTLPANTTSLTATASDPDGTIASYLWEKVSGPTANMSNTTTQTLSLSGLVEGSYTFRVTVTDSRGAKATDEVVVRVNPAPNQAPTVNAGADKTITLPTSTATFTATASDPDGNIASYLWEKVSGPAVIMSGTSTPTLSLSGLVEGTYTFRVSVKDNKGATATDQVVLTVNVAPNQAPTVNAGADQVITLPANTATLIANATDPDGSISAYEWQKVSGPAVTLSGAATETLSLSGLVEGTYTFRVRVTDNRGATATDEVAVRVNAPQNQQPQVSAGGNKSLTLPANSISLTAMASDPDGTIASYVWEKVNGPAATLENANTAILSLSDLEHGSYTFKVTVTDNNGATASDQMTLSVFEEVAGNQAPLANAGADTTVTLPLDYLVLKGSGNDIDGSIVSYLWEQISGPEVRMGLVNSENMELAELVAGTYVFRLTVTDDSGATGTDEMTLTVRTGGEIVNGVEPESLFTTLLAYPNPFEGYINLKLESTRQEVMVVKIFDLLSKVVFEGRIELIPGEETIYTIQLPDSHGRSGIYFLKVQNQKGTFREVIKLIRK